jgi:hypothetical protein
MAARSNRDGLRVRREAVLEMHAKRNDVRLFGWLQLSSRPIDRHALPSLESTEIWRIADEAVVDIGKQIARIDGGAVSPEPKIEVIPWVDQ